MPHTTYAVLTGLRKRGYTLKLDRSDAERGSAYRIALDANAAKQEPAPTEPPIRAPIDGASDSVASPTCDGHASRPHNQDAASGVMAGRRSSGARKGLPLLALRPVEGAALREAVANLAALDLAGLRLQWRNIFGGSALVHLPRPLLARILAYWLQADAFGDLPDTVRRRLESFGVARGPARVGQAGGDGPPCRRRIKSGSILVREWNGRLHRVMALAVIFREVVHSVWAVNADVAERQ